MWPYDIHPPHVINVATLPSESQNTENVILQRDVTKENCIRCHSFIKVDQGHHALNLLIRGVIQQCVYETKIHNIDNLRKPLKQTWFDFAQNITDSAIDQRRDHLRSCVCACWWWILWTHVHLYDSLECFMKLAAVLLGNSWPSSHESNTLCTRLLSDSSY